MKMKNVLLNDRHFLGLALKQARKSVKQGGFPAGAIVVKDGKITSKGIYKSYTRFLELVFIPDFEQESLSLVKDGERKNNL